MISDYLAGLAVFAQLFFPGFGNSTQTQIGPFYTSGGTVRTSSTTADLRIVSLTNCDTIDTDSNGILGCGTDDGGVGGSGFSTTSANWWSSLGLGFSTTSVNYWETTQAARGGGGFSTTSANHWSTFGLGFSTTSANAWQATRNFYSTTSADYWKTQNNFFSTTSANVWSTFGLGFSTTSANYWRSLGLSFSTTSADAWGATKGYSTFAYLFPSNATSTALTFSNGLNVTGGTLAVTATTTTGALQAGSTAIAANVMKVGHLTNLTTSNSESVGGLFNMNLSTTDSLGMALYNNHTGTNRLLSLVCDAATYGGNCFHVRSDGTTSAVNIAGTPVGQGLIKAAIASGGNNDSSVLSLDASGSNAQGLFIKGNNATTTGLINLLDQSSNTLFKVDGYGSTTVDGLVVNDALNIFGTFANSLDDLCVAITGGAGLCDGSDATGAGGTGLATSTEVVDNYIAVGTSANDVGFYSNFTFNNSTNLFTAPYASTTQVSASSAIWYPAGTLAAPGLRLSGTQTGIYSSGVGLDIGIGGTSVLQTTAGAIIPQIFMGTAHTGSASEASYSFTGDANTGMYRSAADTLNLIAGGIEALTLRTSGASTTNLSTAGDFFASSATATSTIANALYVGTSTPTQNLLFAIGSSSPLMTVSRSSGKIGFGGVNTSPSRWAFGDGTNININPNINLLVQDASDARAGVCTSDDCIIMKSASAALGLYAYDYQAGAAKTLVLQEFGGGLDMGTATFTEISNGTAPVADDVGEIAHDSTDNQLILDDRVVRTKVEIHKFAIGSTSPVFASGASKQLPRVEDGYTVTDILCDVEGGTSKVITVFGETITCDADGQADDGSISLAAMAAQAATTTVMGATTGSVNFVNITITGEWTRE